MIERLSGFSPDVLAFAYHGHVTGKDYEAVLIPAVQAATKSNSAVRLYCEIGEDFRGIGPVAVLDDLMIWMAHARRWERVAFVSDADWIRYAVSAFKVVMPGRLKVFLLADASRARRWIAAEPRRRRPRSRPRAFFTS